MAASAMQCVKAGNREKPISKKKNKETQNKIYNKRKSKKQREKAAKPGSKPYIHCGIHNYQYIP